MPSTMSTSSRSRGYAFASIESSIGPIYSASMLDSMLANAYPRDRQHRVQHRPDILGFVAARHHDRHEGTNHRPGSPGHAAHGSVARKRSALSWRRLPHHARANRKGLATRDRALESPDVACAPHEPGLTGYR